MKMDLDTRRKAEREKYVILASRPGSTYGSTNHGKAAIPLVQQLRPRFLVDFGCGRNDFIRELRRLGIDGLGIDFAFPEADIPRPMHKTGLLEGVADVVTSFDALEHLLPEDVDPVFREMRRVARPSGHFIISISTRPSRIKVSGQGLHMTVRPLDWWIKRISSIGVVSEERALGRYVVGQFS